jgi:hypothetical protein
MLRKEVGATTGPRMVVRFFGELMEKVYDEKRLDAKVPAEALRQVQDRAYTSPIWYTPGA